jgi:hypothetical protein
MSKLKRNKTVWQAVALSRLSFNFFSGSALTFCAPHIGQIYWLISDSKLNFKKKSISFWEFCWYFIIIFILPECILFLSACWQISAILSLETFALESKKFEIFSWCSLKRTKHFKAKNVLLSFYHKNRVWKMWNWTRIWSK